MANDIVHNSKEDILVQLISLLKTISEDPSPARCLAKEIEQSVFSAESDEFQRVSATCSECADAMNISYYAIGTLLSKQPEPEEFHERLWEFISSSSLFLTEGERAAALLYVLSDPRLPYVKLPIVGVDDTRFSELLEALDDELKGLSRIAILPFARKTDEASAVLSIVESCQQDDERAVMLAYYLQRVRSANG